MQRPEIDFPGYFYAVLCACSGFACKPESVCRQGCRPKVEYFQGSGDFRVLKRGEPPRKCPPPPPEPEPFAAC